MGIVSVLNSPWAIMPDKLRQIQDIFAAHLRGEHADLARIEADLGRPLENEQSPYEIVDGVAIVPVDGVLAKKMNMFSRISGGSSMQIIGQGLTRAVADERVKAIILDVDSPGGTVDGTQELARLVRTAAGAKPTVALVDGMMASAAYWIGSAADQIYLSADTDQVGSIGVVTSHVDISERQNRIGVKTTEITAGKYKRIASEYAPLSDEGRETLQGMVDSLYTVFVEAVAENRGVTVSQALGMADGRVFIGRAAIGAGLVDGSATMENLIAQLAGGSYRPRRSAAGRPSNVVALATTKLDEPSTKPEQDEFPRLKASAPPALSVDDRCREVWMSDPNVRAEFVNFNIYLGYERARAKRAERDGT